MRVGLLHAVLLAAAMVAASVVTAVGQEKPDPLKRDLDSYRLRVGDEVEILVSRGNAMSPEMSRKLSVPGNGDVSFPPLPGKIHLLDRTVFEIQEAVAQRFKDEAILQNPNVGCVVTHYEPRMVFLIGAVHGQIELPVHRNMRILEVLAKAGSLGYQGADMSHVRVRRTGPDGRPFPFEVNVDDILERNLEQQNIIVFENDIIIVPKLEGEKPLSAEFVYVLGKVHGPGRIPMVKGRTPFTLTKLVALCGDFQEFADRTKVRVIRTTPTGREQTTIDFDDIIEGKRPDFELKPDDLIYVPENWI